ncbi:MAG: hypothetical protein KF857_11435 [Fimbriimonadaceae bacterium]|nr:hypothetical protein [Fimbriimonadaceae bacterium]
MRGVNAFVLFVLVLIALGCGGGGGGVTVVDADVAVVWPARSRGDLSHGLTSAMSASITLDGADGFGNHITFTVDRDPLQPGGYTATYHVPTPVSPQRVSTLRATFYAQAGAAGDVVGTASAPVSLASNKLNLGTITLDSKVKHVTVSPAGPLVAGSAATQLQFSATDADGAAVAVSPGSAVFGVTSGATSLGVAADGMATPLGAGTALVHATVDGVTSPDVAVEVTGGTVVAYSFLSGKSGNLVVPAFDAVQGDLFQVVGGHDIQVTELAVEVQATGQAPREVGLFDSTGTLVAQATIASTDTLANGYYWKAITPVTLTAGQQFYVGALHGTGAGQEYYNDTRAADVAGFVQDIGSFFKASTTLAGGSWQPTLGTGQFGGALRHYTANFKATQL